VLLALAQGAGDERAVVVGPGRLHQLEAQVLAAGAGGVARQTLSAEERSQGTSPVKAMNPAAWAKRRQSPTSAATARAPS
jgi:hypothetical protein